MSTFHSIDNNTNADFSWPREVTGLERIMLSAQGDLQRVMSAFFARPISIATVYSQIASQSPHNTNSPFVPLACPTPDMIASASPTNPIIQTRQVHLQCAGKTICTATSTVRITSPRCAHLFLEEKYAIGQMFRKLERLPQFELVSVGVEPINADESASGSASTKHSGRGNANGDRESRLSRRYKLVVPEFECEIVEVFPSREMFTNPEEWLAGTESSRVDLEKQKEREKDQLSRVKRAAKQIGFIASAYSNPVQIRIVTV